VIDHAPALLLALIVVTSGVGIVTARLWRGAWHPLWLLTAPAFATFVALAWKVRDDDGLTRFDIALAALLSRSASPELLNAAYMVTQAGNAATLYAVGAAVGLFLLWRRQLLMLLVWCATTLGNGALVHGIKALVQRVRPENLHGLVTEGGYSFPSGHAQGSIVVYGMLAYLLGRLVQRRLRAGLLIVASTLVLAIGISRIVLQVHYFTDVLAGLACGACWLALCIALYRRVSGHRDAVVARRRAVSE
jgi:membrane-associated phospholipid phosphatase